MNHLQSWAKSKGVSGFLLPKTSISKKTPPLHSVSGWLQWEKKAVLPGVLSLSCVEGTKPLPLSNRLGQTVLCQQLPCLLSWLLPASGRYWIKKFFIFCKKKKAFQLNETPSLLWWWAILGLNQWLLPCESEKWRFFNMLPYNKIQQYKRISKAFSFLLVSCCCFFGVVFL